jgi:hypothetical protein
MRGNIVMKKLKKFESIKRKIQKYDFTKNNNKESFTLPNFMLLLKELKKDERSYEVVSDLVIEFIKKLKCYDGKMFNHLLQHFLFVNSNTNSCEFESILIDKLYSLTNDYLDNYYTDLFSKALEIVIKYDIGYLIYNKNNKSKVFHCKLNYNVQVINFREKIWHYTFELLNINDILAANVFNSYISLSYLDEVDEQFVQNDLVYIKNNLKFVDKNNTILQVFLLNLKYYMKASGVDFEGLNIVLNFTAKSHYIFNLAFIEFEDNIKWENVSNFQFKLIEKLYNTNTDLEIWWNSLIEVNKPEGTDMSFIVFFNFLKRFDNTKVILFINKLIRSNALNFVNISIAESVFELGLEQQVYSLLLNSESKITTQWLMLHLLIANQKEKLCDKPKKCLFNIFENKLNELDFFYSKVIELLEKDKELFLEISKILLRKLPSKIAVVFFTSIKPDSAIFILNNTKLTTKQTSILKQIIKKRKFQNIQYKINIFQ